MSTPYRFVVPVPRRAATGRVAEVYAASARELGATFAPHLSVAPDLHAATWALLRESLAGAAPRYRKEAVAAAVAVANRCPFCVDAHLALLHATGEHRLAEAVLRGETPADPADAALVAWALASRGATPAPWPFPARHAPEYLGIALVNHFINRMSDALRPGSPLPGGVLTAPARRAAGLALARTVRRALPPGESLRLLAPQAGAEPWWAAGTPIGAAWAAFEHAASAGGDLLGPAARAVLAAAVAGWDGEHPAPGSGWPGTALDGVDERQRPAARLALLAAIAPYRLTDAAVEAWRRPEHTDADLVRLLAFGAVTAVARIASALAARPAAPSPAARA